MQTLTPRTFDPPPEITLSDFRRVHARVTLILPRFYDRESVAMDILLESWLNRQPCPSLAFIRQRCIDAMRQHKKELDLHLDAALHTTHEGPDPLNDLNASEVVNRAVKCLSALEKHAIAYRFFLDLDMAECAHRLKMSEAEFRATLQRALGRMREVLA